MKIPKLTDVISPNPVQDSLNVLKRTPTPVDPLNFCLCHMGFAAALLFSENSKGVESTLGLVCTYVTIFTNAIFFQPRLKNPVRMQPQYAGFQATSSARQTKRWRCSLEAQQYDDGSEAAHDRRRLKHNNNNGAAQGGAVCGPAIKSGYF